MVATLWQPSGCVKRTLGPPAQALDVLTQPGQRASPGTPGAQFPRSKAGARLADTGRFLKHFGEDLLDRAEYWHAVITGRGQGDS